MLTTPATSPHEDFLFWGVVTQNCVSTNLRSHFGSTFPDSRLAWPCGGKHYFQNYYMFGAPWDVINSEGRALALDLLFCVVTPPDQKVLISILDVLHDPYKPEKKNL